MSRSFVWLMGLLTWVGCVGDTTPHRAGIEVGIEDIEVLSGVDLLYRIRDLHVEADGTLWLLSAQPPYVYVFRSGEASPLSFGRKGGGPTEFGAPWSLVAAEEPGSIGIWDAGRRRILYYRLNAGLVRFDTAVAVTGATASLLEELELTAFGTPLRMMRAGSHVIWQPAERPLLRPADLQDLSLVSATDPSAGWHTLYTTTAALRSQAEYLVPVPLWTACAGGTVHVLEPPSTLLAFDPGRGAVDTLRLPLESRKLTDEDLRSFLRHAMAVELRGTVGPPEEVIRGRIEETLRQGRYLFPEQAPAVTRLLCDDAGQVWLQRFSTTDHPVGFSTEWLVLTSSGGVAGVVFPPAFRPLAVNGGRVYGALRDQWDVERPAFWTVAVDLTQITNSQVVPVAPVR